MSAAVILQILAGVIGLIVKWREEYNSPEARKGRQNATTAQGRRDIMSGNVDSGIIRYDNILRDAPSSSNAGSPSTEDAQRRLDAL